MKIDELAINQLVNNKGYETHSALDDCEGCHRVLALELIQRLGPTPHDAPVLTRWILSEEFLSE